MELGFDDGFAVPESTERFWNLGILEFRDSGIEGFWDSLIRNSRIRNPRISWFPNSQFQNSRIPELAIGVILVLAAARQLD
jgi:hypothetical protein